MIQTMSVNFKALPVLVLKAEKMQAGRSYEEPKFIHLLLASLIPVYALSRPRFEFHVHFMFI